MSRSLLIVLLLLLFLGALGSAGYIYYGKQVEESGWNQLYLAEGMLESGDAKTAITTLLPLVQKGKGFSGADRALYRLALAYDAEGHEEALELWNRLASEFPDSSYYLEARQRQANVLMKNKEYDKAEAVFSEISSATDPALRGEAVAGLAKIAENRGDTQKTRELCYKVLEVGEPDSAVAYAKDWLTEQNTAMIWSPSLDEFCELYTVQRGDVPIAIGQKYKTTAWFVLEANHIQGSLHPGQRVKVPKEPFWIVVDKSNCRLNLLTESGKFIKWYPVGIGEQSFKTPAGEYTILDKLIDPKWYKPRGGVVPAGDPENALGHRWMGIGNSLGIHGTNEPDTIGYRKSAGCIRMFNEDVEELYKMATLGTRVTIVEDNVEPSEPS
ncbi:MAG: L,D-transpeptidase family protein [bacterium]|nr:L,D-transpeptidase family protein [bacterium]